jgi:hypothetical protein
MLQESENVFSIFFFSCSRILNSDPQPTAFHLSDYIGAVFRIRIRMDPHSIGRPDPDPHKTDADPKH